MSENIMSITFITENPIMTDEIIKANQSLMKQALDEIKDQMQASSFDRNNSIWRGGNYSDGSYGYGVESFGEWQLDCSCEGNEEEFLCNDEVCYIDELMDKYNKKYPTLSCVWQEDSAKMITIIVGIKPI